MGMMDNFKNKMSDEVRSKYEELKQREQDGNLDDKAKAELDKLRAKFENK